MAGKKDQMVIAVIGGLTKSQSANLTASIMKDKGRVAPKARGTIASGEQTKTGRLLQGGIRKALGTRKEGKK